MDRQMAELEAVKIHGKLMNCLDYALKIVKKLDENTFKSKDNLEDYIDQSLAVVDRIKHNNFREEDCPEIISNAMMPLSVALEILQDITPKSANIDEITRTVAKAIAMMYPISKLLYGPSKVPKSPRSHYKEQSVETDRRQAKRIAIEAHISFQSDTNFFVGFAEDVSVGGIFVSTYDIRQVGSLIDLHFTLPNGHLISTQGVVRWVHGPGETGSTGSHGMGISFESLLDEDKKLIEQFIEKRPPFFYDS